MNPNEFGDDILDGLSGLGHGFWGDYGRHLRQLRSWGTDNRLEMKKRGINTWFSSKHESHIFDHVVFRLVDHVVFLPAD